jgi:hypothetical protein
MEVLTLAQFGSTILGKIKIKNWASMSAGEREFFRERWAGMLSSEKRAHTRQRSRLPALRQSLVCCHLPEFDNTKVKNSKYNFSIYIVSNKFPR